MYLCSSSCQLAAQSNNKLWLILKAGRISGQKLFQVFNYTSEDMDLLPRFGIDEGLHHVVGCGEDGGSWGKNIILITVGGGE